MRRICVCLVLLSCCIMMFYGCTVTDVPISVSESPSANGTSEPTPAASPSASPEYTPLPSQQALPSTASTPSPESAAETPTPSPSETPASPSKTPVPSPSSDPGPAASGGLTGAVIYIDAGHQRRGNSDKEPVAPGSSVMKAKVSSGTTGVSTGNPEYILNLEVSLLLREKLEALGATVYMSRTDNDIDISNKERAEQANALNVDFAIRIHANGSDDPAVHGYLIFVPADGCIPDKATVEKSVEFGRKLDESIAAFVGTKSLGLLATGDLTGFNWSTVPVVLIEMGFMTNPEEDELMRTPEFQNAMVDAVADALAKMY